MRRLALIGVACGLQSLCDPASASAQTMRTLSISRPVGSEPFLHVTLDYAGGIVVVAPSRDNALYRLKLRYDAERYLPVQQYDARTGILRLGVESSSGVGVRASTHSERVQSARFEFSPRVALSLDVNLGASDADIDLGGTNLTALVVSSSASHGIVDFSTPTRGTCRSATFSVGASELEVRHLAQAGCAELRVSGGAGSATLSFDGAWRRDAALVVDLAMGKLVLRVPAGTGVRLSGERFLAPFDRSGFTKTGNTWTTPGYARAELKLDAELKAALVGIRVEWIGKDER